MRLHLVKTHGLPQLKQLLERSDALPVRVQHLILTFACTDFEEVNPICKCKTFLCLCNCTFDFLPRFLGETESPTTYHVKCLYDQEQKTYRASFFISEVDKVNLNFSTKIHNSKSRFFVQNLNCILKKPIFTIFLLVKNRNFFAFKNSIFSVKSSSIHL